MTDRDTSSVTTPPASDSGADAWTRFWFTPGPIEPIHRMRRVVAMAAIYYLISWLLDLQAWIGPHGLLPPQTAAKLATDFGGQATARWSWLYLSDASLLIWLTWTIALSSSAAMLAGRRPAWATAATWISVLMFCHRVWLVTTPFEWLLSSALFYLTFAIDQRPESWNAGVIRRLFQVHLTGIYVATGLTQLAGRTWWEGDAVWWLMANSQTRLLDLTGLGATQVGLFAINALTHAVVVIGLLFPVLIWTSRHRNALLRVVSAYWLVLAILTGWLGYCGLMLALTLLAWQESVVTQNSAK